LVPTFQTLWHYFLEDCDANWHEVSNEAAYTIIFSHLTPKSYFEQVRRNNAI